MLIDPAPYIEHTNLNQDIKQSDVERLLEEAIDFNFKGICIPPFWVKKARRDLGSESEVSLVTVVGFPLGYSMTETKLKECEMALKDGADEIDLVWNVSSFKSEMIWPKIEIVKMAKICHEASKMLKVIIETSLLNNDELEQACKICVDAGADFVKTSTGFNGNKAELNKVKLMRDIIPDQVGIKASGGIRDYNQFTEFINAGAERIGTSNGVGIQKEYLELIKGK